MNYKNEIILKSLFHTFNHIIFSCKLIETNINLVSNMDCRDAVQYNGSKNILGYFDPVTKEIFLNKEILNNDKEIVEVLVHEMIHLYQAQYKTSDQAHGTEYQKWRRKIKRRFNIEV